MALYLIAAVAKNLAIGNKNKLLYWLPDDLKRFKRLTSGHTVVMGRRTFDSLPKGALPNRRNIVLSRTQKALEGCEVFGSLEEALQHCAADEDVFVMGGESVYRAALPLADGLFLTEIDDTPAEADAFFPPFEGWEEVHRESHDIDEKHRQAFSFVDYARKRD